MCPPGSAAPAAVAVMAPQCLTPEGCAAGLRCDAAARRCVASMGGACTGNADCDVGLACAGGRCAPSPMPAPGARQACRTDADCPDQRCDRGSGACGGFTTNGQRACALTRECLRDYACVGGACRPSGSYVCAGASDCPAAHECRRSRCVPSAAPSCTDARECPQGDYACVDGRCVLLVVCAPDQTLCSNRCVSPSSTSYCVACGLVSHERPNATATCGNRGLRLSCRGMFGDCDGNTENGCEAPLFSNTHCGRCGAACANGQTCDGGRCGTVARSTVVQVALGRAHGCARYANGRVRCWGVGPGGPPPGTTPAARTPPEDMGLDGVTQIVSGSNHACALRDDRRLWCWGRNNLRQLGDGTAIDRPTPVLVRSGVLEVAAGDEFTCVRGADTQIVCWGANAQGQLGPMRNADGSMGTLQITPELNFAQIAAGRGHACLRSATGAVHCWGRNASGQSLGALADGRAALQSGPTDVAEISLAGDVSVARKNDGTVWVWGAPVGGPDAVPLSRRATPTQVPLPGPAVQVAAGPLHICARLMDNRVVCWGQGDVVRSPTPRVMGSEAASTVAVGLQNACVVRNSDSAVLCWGSGDEGMMLPSGDGARVENPTAMPLF